MNHEEIEVKFIIDDLQAMRQRIIALGATLKTPRTYEDNRLFDTPDQRLTQQQCLLRLRRDQPQCAHLQRANPCRRSRL